MLDNGGNPALGRLALTATIQRRLLIIAVVSGLTAVLCYLVGGFPYSSRAIGVACGLVLLIAIGALQGTSVHDRRFFYSVLAVQGALGLAVILFGPFQKRLFGDGAALLRIVEEGTLYPRWLGITAMLRFFYHTVGLGSVLGVESFIRVVGWGAMVGGFAFAGRCAASPFPFLLVLTLPLSFVFIAGHIEIYSAVTGLLSVALATLDRWSLDRASALKILVIAALLPWLYLGFAPFGAILVGVVCLARPRLGILVGRIREFSYLTLFPDRYRARASGAALSPSSPRGCLDLFSARSGFLWASCKRSRIHDLLWCRMVSAALLSCSDAALDENPPFERPTGGRRGWGALSFNHHHLLPALPLFYGAAAGANKRSRSLLCELYRYCVCAGEVS